MERSAARGVEEAGIDVHRWLLPVIAIGTMLAPLNSTMIAVAFPDIRHAFGVSVTEAAWLLTPYLVAMTVMQSIGGWLGDALGRRRVYLTGLVWFGLAGVGCALAPNLMTLIVSRTMQGVAGALIFPNGRAIVREVRGGNHRSSGFGIITFARGLGAAVGPPLGGVLVHLAGWSSIFWVNVPVVGLALLLGWPSLPRRDVIRAPRSRFDWSGAILLTLSLSAFIAVPTVYEQSSLALAWGVGVAAVVVGAVFVWRELAETAPVVNLRLFRHPPFGSACAAVALNNLILYATWLAVPLYLEEVRGRTVPVAGMTLAIMSVCFAIAGELGGRLADRRGHRLPLMGGALCLLAGVALAAGAYGTVIALTLAAALAVMGVGLGLPDAATQQAAFEPVPQEHAGAAGGVYTTVRYLGIIAGTTIVAFVFVNAPQPGESAPFVALFAGLAVVALAGVAVTWRVAISKPAS